MTIDTSNRSQLVRDHLLGYMRQHRLGQGDRLPSEADMALELGVSRNTIREAYISLEAEGTIIRRHGIGTFVSHPPKVRDSLLGELIAFPYKITAAGFTFDFKIVAIEQVPVPTTIAESLHCDPAGTVLRVKHTLFADNIPAVHIVDHFAPHVDTARFAWETFAGDMLAFVSTSLGIKKRHILSRFRAVIAEAEVAHQLDLAPGTPIINIHSIVSTFTGQEMTYSLLYLNPERVECELVRVYEHS